MPEKRDDQKGQGNPNDQNKTSGQTTQGNYGQISKTPVKSETDTAKTESSESPTNTGSNAGIQNQGKTNVQNQTKQTSGSTNLKDDEDDDEEDLKEYEDLEHPHKVDTPTASNQNETEIGENTIEGENQGADRITNRSEDVAF